MDLAWAVQVLLAAASIVIDRKDELLTTGNSSTSDPNFAFIDADGSRRSSSHRQPRIVTLPPGGYFYAGFIFGVPVSIMLPIVRLRTRDPPPPEEKGDSGEDPEGNGSNGGNVPDGDFGENDDSGRNGEQNGPRGLDAEGPMIDEDLVHEEQLQKLDEYFNYMQFTTEKCRRRIVCEVAAAADDFYPVSDIILRQLRPRAPIHPSSKSRFARFVEAAKLGFNGDLQLCTKEHKCHDGGADVLDQKMLRVFRLIGRRLNIKFIDR